ncbi:TIGR00282 family metallophosphoesterase [Desulfallas sp. Bu1-1]|uniref:TIGR00282 family metallophosphoesterase n=1 Tax=Desulfallas sp. Bu1-1 TaxID=2787620 RepID=UPI00189E2E14|nr:TIGR00282 family metallophosphoesterase [Desulfallas sp. Bu1-1]MBF7083050.1 TIGR00282 family metallophosphoesterase [Desulfallas sp. Bu1-1]
MRLLMIGDIVGRPGRRAVKENIPELVRDEKIDLVIANGENSAGGNGITREVARELFSAGVDVITMGNHVWNKKEALDYIAKENRIIRPANYPPGTPGMGFGCFKTKTGFTVGIFNLSGRVFMPDLDCPFRCADKVLKEFREQSNIILLDFHAEATSEKAALAYYLDGRLSAVCGTHTHVQTADERILPGGTAFITDVGMTGPRDSVIGVKKDLVTNKFLTQLPVRFEVAGGLYQLNAVIIDVDAETGKAVNIKRIQNYE